MHPVAPRRSSIVRIASVIVFGAFAAATACSATGEDLDSEALVGTEEPVDSGDFAVAGDLSAGMTLEATTNVNLRASASTSAKVLRVVPEGSAVKVVDGTPQNGFYKVNHNGLEGWSFGQYYDVVAGGGGTLGDVAVGDTLRSTTTVNLRSGPSTAQSILTVVPEGATVTVENATPSNDFYYVNYNGTVGWSSGKYYEAAVAGEEGPSDVIRDAMERAESAMGFGYWWGHGRFLPEGPSASNKGQCSGSCPSCTYSGSYGGDCSGFAAKVWAVPGTNTDLKTDSHPYSTANFNENTSQWSSISRDNVKKGDAMVYRSGGAGHIFIYSSGDAWGTMYSYECKGCSAGCVYGSRTASTQYKAIRRAGW